MAHYMAIPDNKIFLKKKIQSGDVSHRATACKKLSVFIITIKYNAIVIVHNQNGIMTEI